MGDETDVALKTSYFLLSLTKFKMRNFAAHRNPLEGLRAFKPVLAACHQGQRKEGVNDGAKYVYDQCFSHIC